MDRRLGYLCGALRISTYPHAKANAPRAHVLGTMRAFEELGWEVKPFIFGDRAPRKWIAEGTEQAASAGVLQTLAADLLRLSLGVVNARRAWRELGGRVDWVYERHTVFQELGWIFKRRGMPWILEVNGPLFYEAKVERNSIVLHKLARRLEIRAYRRCDILVSVTEAGKEIAIREAGIRPEKVVVLPNGVDTALLDPERHEPEEVFDNFTIGFAGSLLPWQALGLLLETLRDMRKEGADISLLVVGDGSMRKAWEAQARQLGISENVLFTGWMPWQEVPRFISGFDVGYSGQTQMQVGSMYHSPLKIYEYMAMGKPVVASAFEDAKRVVRDRETGFLFEDGDKASLKRALSEAYGSRDTLPEMGRKAREEVVAHHSWTARVRTLISEIERILRSGP